MNICDGHRSHTLDQKISQSTQKNMPQWVLRNKGLLDYKAYLALFDPPEEETTLPKLQIVCCDDSSTQH
jgi:hypothetical protein